MAMGIYVGAGSVKTVSSIYVGAGGVKTVKEVYVGAGGVQKVWPTGYYLFDGNISNWIVSKPSAVSSSNVSAGTVESYGLQISSSSTYQDWSGYKSGVQYEIQYIQFSNSSITFPDTLDNYTYICFEYNPGNQSTGDTSSYSKYLSWAFSFSSYNSRNGNTYYYWPGTTGTAAGGTGTVKLTISSSTKSSYNSYMSDSNYSKHRFNVGGWDSDKIHSNDEDDEYTVYYNSGYITAVWMEE